MAVGETFWDRLFWNIFETIILILGGVVCGWTGLLNARGTAETNSCCFFGDLGFYYCRFASVYFLERHFQNIMAGQPTPM